MPIVSCSKGIECETGALMPEVLAQTLPQALVAVLSGPAFARELAADLPTGVTFACADTVVGERISRAMATPRFWTYLSDDVVGAAIGGAMKNVLAIACGIAEGRKLGTNARATLITRGLAETARLGLAKGARLETFIGLSGIGDLTLTCNNMQSRNFSLGVALGEGRRLADVLSERREATEGAHSAAAVASLARRLGVRMPITMAVDSALNHAGDLGAIVSDLMAHPWHMEGVLAG
jgi:glycerol-3-phosphate dehydrogenase (NAD(P)+)